MLQTEDLDIKMIYILYRYLFRNVSQFLIKRYMFNLTSV
jgi:hypothetical protein